MFWSRNRNNICSRLELFYSINKQIGFLNSLCDGICNAKKSHHDSQWEVFGSKNGFNYRANAWLANNLFIRKINEH